MVNTAIRAIQERISAARQSMFSVVQLQQSIREPALILECFVEMVTEIGEIKEGHLLLSKAFELIQKLEYKDSWLRPLLLSIWTRISSPWIRLISDWSGLSNAHYTSHDMDFMIGSLFMKFENQLSEEGEELDGNDELV